MAGFKCFSFPLVYWIQMRRLKYHKCAHFPFCVHKSWQTEGEETGSCNSNNRVSVQMLPEHSRATAQSSRQVHRRSGRCHRDSRPSRRRRMHDHPGFAAASTGGFPTNEESLLPVEGALNSNETFQKRLYIQIDTWLNKQTPPAGFLPDRENQWRWWNKDAGVATYVSL